jgi:hypothetical protein
MRFLMNQLTATLQVRFLVSLSEWQKDIPVDLLALTIASSYLALLTWWLDHGLPYTPEQMDMLYQQLVFPGVQGMLAS